MLGSRVQFCIHPTVSKLKGEAQNQSCRVHVASHKCQYYDTVEGMQNITSLCFTNAEVKKETSIIEQIADIEDLVQLGNYHCTCPYYLSRELQKTADMIFLPYNYLVDSDIRQSLNINLTDAVVIFDEAHNLVLSCMC